LGRGKAADRIAKYVGGLGKVRDKDGHLIVPDAWFYVIEAAEVLNCSAVDLDGHPDKAMWMQRAQDYKNGLAEGERLLKTSRDFWKIQKANWKKEEAARGK
jgi:hypothetical protein